MKLVHGLSFIYMMFFGYAASSYAAILDIENGVLMGAKGVNVNGAFYDVTFQDGTCFDLFDGCNDLSDFTFPVPDRSGDSIKDAEARKASQALLDQVFIDSSLGLFDSDPTLTNGCNNLRGCFAYTPIFPIITRSPGHFESLSADNWATVNTDTIGFTSGTPVTADFSPFLPNPGSDTSVFAIWSNSNTTVPVPASVWLFASGLIGLVGMKKELISS